MEESIERVKEYLKNFEGDKKDFEAILDVLNGYTESKSDKEIETSDKNVVNIEEDIKYVKEMLEIARVFFKAVKAETNYKDVDDVAFCNAVEHILAEREQDKKRIQELEAERQMVGMPVKNKKSGKIGIVLHQWKSGSIAVLENINPRVINTHESWNTLEIITDEVKQTKTKDDSIPKQKVKDKIEEVHNMKFEDERLNSVTIDFAVHKFEELLEDK